MAIWHLTWSSEGRLALFPEEEQRRAALRAIARVVGDKVLLFSLVDDHLHLVVDAETAGRPSRAVQLALRTMASAPLGPAHRREVAERSHLEFLVRYHLTQADKQGLPGHAALASGSCLPDLLLARVIFPGIASRLRAQLPRFRLRSAMPWVGLAQEPLTPVDDDAVRRLGPSRLLDAAAAALAAGPDLSGKAAERVAARRAAASLGRTCGIATTELAWALDQPARTVRRLSQQPVPAELLAAVRRRLALEEAARS